MGRNSFMVKSDEHGDVRFTGNWSRFTALLEVVAMFGEEDDKKKMEAPKIDRKYLKPRRSGSKKNNKFKKNKMRKKPATTKKARPELSSSRPDLPESFKNAIHGVDGKDIMLVIQKSLFKTDVNSNNGRLAMLFSQIRRDFLTETERRALEEGKDKKVILIEPSLKERTISMKQWNMEKKTGRTSSMYALKTTWNEVVHGNGLKENDVVQVWSFRVGQELRLALVLVERAAGNHNEEDDDDKY